MALSRDELHKWIDQVPDDKLPDVRDFLKKIVNPNINDKFHEALNYTFGQYDETLKKLKDR